jgi:glucose/arabinose dehydrogenase
MRSGKSGEYAKHVARVGALAVALGVGGAFASTPGLAWADESASIATDAATPDEPAESPASTSSPESTEGNQAGSADPADDDPPAEQSSGSTAQSTTVADGVTVSSSGGALTSGTDADDDEPPEAEGEPPAVGTTEPSADEDVVAVATEDNGLPLLAGTGWGSPALNDPPAHHAVPTDEPLTNSANRSAADFNTAATLFTTTAVTADAMVPAAAPVFRLPPPETVIRDLKIKVTACVCSLARKVVKGIETAFTSLFGSSLASATPSAPAAPPTDSPAMWGLVAWVRRQLDAVLQSPGVAKFIEDAKTQAQKVWYRLITCGQDLGLEEGFERTTVVSGLNEPTDFRFTPDGNTIFVTEKSGAIRVVENGVLRPDPWVVLPTLSDLGERGLSGIELHPDFDGQNGYIYVAYTNMENHDVLSQITVTDGEFAGELELLESTLPTGQIHHGGEIRFGPDGMLYWSVGDNGNNRNAQDLTNIHGKVLRMDPMTGRAPDPSLHEPNPTFGDPDALEQIYAYGLRNPYRFTFTPNGKMLLADVGEASWEELNIIEPGGNYGWPAAEGVCRTTCGEYIDPIYTYAHTPPPVQQGAITAATIFTSDAFGPAYENKVFIADYSLGWIKELTFDDEYSTFVSERMFDGNAGTTVRLAVGPDGNLYQLTIYPGVLTRIAVSDGNRAPAAVITAEPTNGPSPLEVQFFSTGSTDSEGQTLTYAWDFGDGTTSTERDPIKTYASATVTTYTVTLTVSDGVKTGQATTSITIGSTSPAITELTTSADNGKYNAGQTIRLEATAFDADQTADTLTYKWTVVFHHAGHVHPYQQNILGPVAEITLSDDRHNYADTWYEITLEVADSSGLSTTESVEIFPNLVDLSFSASDPAATFTIDGIPYTGFHTERAVVGVRRELDAPSTQVIDGRVLVFSGWSDGGAQLHTIITPGTNATYAVTYETAAIATFDVQPALV